jgi:undecaprenyl-diphosphatase
MFLGVFFAPFTRFARPLLLFWAALIAFSQVYVGVHFPLDVVCGATIGGIIGWLTGVWGYKMA